MNLSRTAIRYELSSGSAAVLVRFYLRIQLLWILIWAASDVFLVWYWTGRISGPGAHEYFGRWILAWFFTQKVPLYFLSLPYKGGRATIGSMYAYLNWRLYQGRSFGQWFASCSVWGTVPACLTLVAVYFFLRNPEDQPEGKHLRGLMLIPPRQRSRTSTHGLAERAARSRGRPSAHSTLDRVRAFPHHGSARGGGRLGKNCRQSPRRAAARRRETDLDC